MVAPVTKTLTAVFYASAGKALQTFVIERGTGAIDLRHTIELRAEIHYMTLHPSRRYLYVAASDRSQVHLIHAFAIEPATGAHTARRALCSSGGLVPGDPHHDRPRGPLSPERAQSH
jgi:6-phosphogluconolactonase (cycloisomerase 2 family)